jgi:hypothetical protein
MTLIIRFSHNYNKLKDRIFTTLRHSFNYYAKKVGKEFDVIFKGKYKFKAVLMACIGRNETTILSETFFAYDTEGLYKLKGNEEALLIFIKSED